MCLRVAHDATDYWSARVTEPHIVVVLVPMVRTTAFAGRYKNKLCVNLRMYHRWLLLAGKLLLETKATVDVATRQGCTRNVVKNQVATISPPKKHGLKT